jgi:hypothetical protein
MCPQVCDPPQAREQLSFRTMGGRDVRVGRTALGDTKAPGRHVSLHLGHAPGGEDGAGAALTPAQARQLAGALLQQAAAEDGTAGATAGRVEVSYLSGESYAVAARGHALLTDQPATAGGADTAITPTELDEGPVAGGPSDLHSDGLKGCADGMGEKLARFIRRHGRLAA